jgi:hypothetical protein
MFRVFLDDIREPDWVYPDDKTGWTICRSMGELRNVVRVFGIPTMISFDHDLGDNEPTGMDIAKWLVELDLNFKTMPKDFQFKVHSSNPCGRENIESLLNNYLLHRNNNGLSTSTE